MTREELKQKLLPQYKLLEIGDMPRIPRDLKKELEKKYNKANGTTLYASCPSCLKDMMVWLMK